MRPRYHNNGFVLTDTELMEYLIEECTEEERERIIQWLDSLDNITELIE